MTLQKLYGRDVANTETVINLFQRLLSNSPADKVVKAFEVWMERSQEFPTPADIFNLIKRNGKPPLRESDIIAIRKREVCDWTRAESRMVEEWEGQQMTGWPEDNQKDEITIQENFRLRHQVKELQVELKRMQNLLHAERVGKFIEKPKPSLQQKIDSTVQGMRENGASQSDIDDFLQMYQLPAVIMEHNA